MIGLSVSRCIPRIASGMFKIEDIELIIAGTRCPTHDSWKSVIDNCCKYYWWAYHESDLRKMYVQQYLDSDKVNWFERYLVRNRGYRCKVCNDFARAKIKEISKIEKQTFLITCERILWQLVGSGKIEQPRLIDLGKDIEIAPDYAPGKHWVKSRDEVIYKEYGTERKYRQLKDGSYKCFCHDHKFDKSLNKYYGWVMR